MITQKYFFRREIRLNEFMEDPLLAFQVNDVVFRSPTLLEMFLYCLRGILKCSASFYTHTMLTEFRVRNRKDQNQNDLNDCEKIKDRAFHKIRS